MVGGSVAVSWGGSWSALGRSEGAPLGPGGCGCCSWGPLTPAAGTAFPSALGVGPGAGAGGGSGRVPWPCAGSSAQLCLLPAPRTRPVHLPAESRLLL